MRFNDRAYDGKALTAHAWRSIHAAADKWRAKCKKKIIKSYKKAKSYRGLKLAYIRACNSRWKYAPAWFQYDEDQRDYAQQCHWRFDHKEAYDIIYEEHMEDAAYQWMDACLLQIVDAFEQATTCAELLKAYEKADKTRLRYFRPWDGKWAFRETITPYTAYARACDKWCNLERLFYHIAQEKGFLTTVNK